MAEHALLTLWDIDCYSSGLSKDLLLPTAVTLRVETVAALATQRQVFDVQERLTDLLRPQGVYAPRPEPIAEPQPEPELVGTQAIRQLLVICSLV